MQGKFRPEEQSIAEILHRKTPYVVPLFQREYSWEKDKIETFWDDLFVNHEKVGIDSTNSENEYYFGAMVFLHERGQREIILVDGQQRMATITTFLSVIRDILHKLTTADIDNEIKTKAVSGETFLSSFIQESTDEDELDFWKIKLNVRNNDFFRKHIQRLDDPEIKISNMKGQSKKSRSEKNLEDAYNFLFEKIKKYQNQFELNDQPIKLRSLAARLLDWFAIISIGVSNEEDAFDIFETLNERGEPLIIGDLVKNMLMKKITDTERAGVDNNWGIIMDNLRGEHRRIDQFLTYSLYSRRFFGKGKLSKNNLFKIIKELTPDESKVLDYVTNLVQDSEIYDFLINPEDYRSFWDDDDLVHYLSSLKLLTAERTLPCLLSAYRQFGTEKSEFKELVRIILSFFFRFKTFADGSAAGVLKQMVEVSAFISGLDITKTPSESCEPWKTSKIKEKLKDAVVSDDKFKDKFSEWLLESSTISRYVLYELENIYAGERNEELRPVTKLTWEHILPDKHEEFWSDFPDADNYVKRLGNMTILKGKLNSRIKNKDFSTKKEEAYESSALKINIQTVNSHDEWTPEIIDKRQKEFAEKAVDIWGF